MLSFQGRPHVRTASCTSSVALPLPPATPSGPPRNIGMPSRLRVVSPGRSRRWRSGRCPRSPSCCAWVWARKLAPRNTVCFPVFLAQRPHSHTGVTAVADGSRRQRDRADHNTPLRACRDHTCGAIEGSGTHRGRQTPATRHAEYRSENWSVGEVHLQARVAKVLRPQKDQHALGGELVLAQFYARVLNVLRQLRTDKIPVTRWRRECLDLLDGVVGFMRSPVTSSKIEAPFNSCQM